jgi:4'-phosphopantetheinyl transferase
MWNTTYFASQIQPGEIHVWRVFFSTYLDDIDAFVKRLLPAESERAARFRAEHARHEYIISRIFLRAVLGSYLNIPPALIQFRYGPRGKPSLAGDISLRFNLSHSRDVALLAITWEREIGADVEYIRPIPEADDIVGNYFSPNEITVFSALPASEKPAAFFRCWTRKEAYIKACGDGLSIPLDSFDVTLAPRQPARLLRVEGNPAEVERWALLDVPVVENYAAALCVEGKSAEIACWDWTI